MDGGGDGGFEGGWSVALRVYSEGRIMFFDMERYDFYS